MCNKQQHLNYLLISFFPTFLKLYFYLHIAILKYTDQRSLQIWRFLNHIRKRRLLDSYRLNEIDCGCGICYETIWPTSRQPQTFFKKKTGINFFETIIRCCYLHYRSCSLLISLHYTLIIVNVNNTIVYNWLSFENMQKVDKF